MQTQTNQFNEWKKYLSSFILTPCFELCCLFQYIPFSQFQKFIELAQLWNNQNVFSISKQTKSNLCLLVKKSDLINSMKFAIKSIPIQILVDLIDISTKGFISLSKYTTNLRYLTLHQSNRIVSDILEESFSHWKNLIGICLFQAEDDQIKAIIYKLRKLQELYLYNANIGDTGANYISIQLLQLKSLQIRQSKQLTNSGISCLVSKLKKVRSFAFTSYKQTLNIMSYNILTIALNMRKLKCLTIGQGEFSNHQALVIAAHLHELESLQLVKPKIGNIIILKLARNFKLLKYMKLIDPLVKEDILSNCITQKLKRIGPNLQFKLV